MSRQQAYLWVTADVGHNSTLEEFHDWYDNEHVPLRMESNLPEVLTGARYQAADGQYPGWSAMYEVSTPEFFKQDKYTRLRANRSPREANLIGRLSILDRRTYTSLVADSAEVPPRGKERASPYLVTVASDEVKGEEAVRVLEGVEGWTRSHAYKLGDALTIGEGREPSTRAPAYVVVHEFASDGFTSNETYLRALPTGAEVRRWKLYRAWSNTANA